MKRLLSSGPVGTAISRVASSWNRKRFLVICYHSVATLDEHEWDPELYVTSDRLRARFQRLRELEASVLSLDEALARQQEGSLPKRAVVLTFDDGTADFSSHVVPLLREFSYPATVYLPTERVGSPARHWPSYAYYLFWRSGERTAEKARNFSRRWQGYPVESQERALKDLARELGIDERPFLARRAFQMMTPEDIRALPLHLVSVQLHTHSHTQPRDHEAYFASLEMNRTHIARYTGIVPEHFCYPSGRYSPEFAAWLAEFGVRTATTCQSGSVGPETERLRLPRLIDTMWTPESTFDGWVHGSLSALVHFRRTLRHGPGQLAVASA